MTGEALRGHLDLLLLSVLEEAPRHGYAVAEALRARSAGQFNLPEGTIYPALHRLERAGVVASRWEEVGGRRRRVYRLTRRGRRALACERARWMAFSQAVTRVVSPA